MAEEAFLPRFYLRLGEAFLVVGEEPCRRPLGEVEAGAHFFATIRQLTAAILAHTAVRIVA